MLADGLDNRHGRAQDVSAVTPGERAAVAFVLCLDVETQLFQFDNLLRTAIRRTFDRGNSLLYPRA